MKSRPSDRSPVFRIDAGARERWEFSSTPCTIEEVVEAIFGLPWQARIGVPYGGRGRVLHAMPAVGALGRWFSVIGTKDAKGRWESFIQVEELEEG